MNFAGVFQVPAVFFCSNNQFAISTRMRQQTHAETLAQKGLAYGIPSYRLDGMDVLATYVMVKDAMDRARNGGGPTFIEGLCYRFGPHTTSDNPDLYRSPEEVEKAMKESDPIARFHNYLVKKKLWDSGQEKRLKDELADEVNKAAKEAEETPAPPLDELFENVFAAMPGYLKDELDYFHRLPGGK
jgi:pyruvate dehydrogenase E1 component alpha subunit